MNNKEIYNKVFISVFNVTETYLEKGFSMNSVVEWDSLAHILLITELEKAFNIHIMLDSEEFLEFKSYEEGKYFLRGYNINIE